MSFPWPCSTSFEKRLKEGSFAWSKWRPNGQTLTFLNGSVMNGRPETRTWWQIFCASPTSARTNIHSTWHWYMSSVFECCMNIYDMYNFSFLSFDVVLGGSWLLYFGRPNNVQMFNVFFPGVVSLLPSSDRPKEEDHFSDSWRRVVFRVGAEGIEMEHVSSLANLA